MNHIQKILALLVSVPVFLFAVYTLGTPRGEGSVEVASSNPTSSQESGAFPLTLSGEGPSVLPASMRISEEVTPTGNNQGLPVHSPSPLGEVQEELATQISSSLDGTLFINHVIDQILPFADLPIDERVDFEYGRDEVAAYRIKGLPEGTTGHFMVGLEPFFRDGKEINYFQMEIEMGGGQLEFNRETMRAGPRIHITLDYDVDGNPDTFAMVTERKISLRQSRNSGIDAYKGRYTSGAGYKVSMKDPHNPMSETFGLIDGRYVHGVEFGGIRPLHGILEMEQSRIDALFERFQKHYTTISVSDDED